VRHLALFLLVFALLALPGAVPAQAPVKDGEQLAHRVAEAAGLSAWSKLSRLQFIWLHKRKGIHRTYDWNIAEKKVLVTIGEKSALVPLDADPMPAGLAEFHRAFVNDSTWLLIELRLAWDENLHFEKLGPRKVPGIPHLGELPALSVTYPPRSNHQPGDRYVLYLGDDHLPRAWSYHRSGGEPETVVSTRETRHEIGGLKLPCRFVANDGKLIVEIIVTEAL